MSSILNKNNPQRRYWSTHQKVLCSSQIKDFLADTNAKASGLKIRNDINNGINRINTKRKAEVDTEEQDYIHHVSPTETSNPAPTSNSGSSNEVPPPEQSEEVVNYPPDEASNEEPHDELTQTCRMRTSWFPMHPYTPVVSCQ